MTDKPDLTALAAEIHAENVAAGWWDTPDKTGLLVTKMMLVITELSEAVEGDRKSLMDDHLPQYPMAHVELADAMIRLLDIVGFAKIDPTPARQETPALLMTTLVELSFPEMMYSVVTNMTRPDFHAAAKIMSGVELIALISQVCDFNIWEVVDAKREYNRNRLDHKRSERAKKHGKAY